MVELESADFAENVAGTSAALAATGPDADIV